MGFLSANNKLFIPQNNSKLDYPLIASTITIIASISEKPVMIPSNQPAANKKMDLNTYLARYAQNQELKRRPFESTGRLNTPNTNSRFQMVGAGQQQPIIDGQQKQQPFSGLDDNYVVNTVFNYVNPSFEKAQVQCLQELQEIKRGLNDQDRAMTYFMNNYYKRLLEDLHKEHYRVREKVLEVIDRNFQENERRINEAITSQNGIEPIDFTNTRKRIAQINLKIQKLEQGLKSPNYRPSIAEVVTCDFESELKDIQGSINNTQRTIMENAPHLTIDEVRMNRINDDTLNLVIIEDIARKVNPTASGSLRVGNGGKLGLFNSGVAPSQANSRMTAGIQLNTHQNRDAIQGNTGGGFFNW